MSYIYIGGRWMSWFLVFSRTEDLPSASSLLPRSIDYEARHRSANIESTFEQDIFFTIFFISFFMDVNAKTLPEAQRTQALHL